MPQAFRRTKIRSLEVSGYRSLKHIKLDDLGDIVVLHGPNGCGKSNILRAIDCIMHWATLQFLPTQAQPLVANLVDPNYHQQIKLRPEDFAFGSKQIDIRTEIQLGDFQKDLMEGETTFSTLHLQVVAQDRGQELHVWFEVFRLDGSDLLSLTSKGNEAPELTRIYQQIAHYESQIRKYEIDAAQYIGKDEDVRNIHNNYSKQLHDAQKARDKIEQSAQKETLLKVRAKTILIPHLFLHIGAYRTGKSTNDDPNSMQQGRLVQEKDLIAYLASSQLAKAKRRRELTNSLSQVLNQAGFKQSALAPIWDSTVGGFELLATMPNGQEHAVSMSGTGKQQLVWMFTNLYINRAAIVMIEEPEAHLHRNMVLDLAEFFKREMNPEGANDTFVINQLWIETHHHAFALAAFYLDVSMNEEGWTEVRIERRSRAIEHFYEPSPFWDALRQLVAEAIDEEDVVFQDAKGLPVTAKMLKESIDGDRALANEYASAMTEMAIMAMRRGAKKGTR